MMTDPRQQIHTYLVTPTSLMVSFGEVFTDSNAQKVEQFLSALTASSPFWLVDYIPSYTTVLIHYREGMAAKVQSAIDQLLITMAAEDQAGSSENVIAGHQGKTVVIPVCYDSALALDLLETADELGLSVADLVEKHTAMTYRCYALGFLPGFAFLGRLPDELVVPRLARPRERLPAGSVAIAEQQTTVYPSETPGGWRIIGRTPMPMFFPERNPPIRIEVGDTVRFSAISREEFDHYQTTFPEAVAC